MGNFLKFFGKKKKSYVLPVRPDGRRSEKAQSIWKEDVQTLVGKYKCSARDKKYSKMRSMVSSECKTEQVKDCRIKSFLRNEGIGTHKDRRSLAVGGEGA